MDILRRHDLPFSCVNRVELDRQHLSDVDLVIAVGGDGTVLSAAHFLDHGTSEYVLPLLVLYSAYYHCDFDTDIHMKTNSLTRYAQTYQSSNIGYQLRSEFRGRKVSRCI